MAIPAGKKLDDQSPPLLIHCWALLVFEFHHFSKSPQLYKAFSPRATIWTLSSVKTINKWFSWSGTFLSFISIMDVCIKYSCFQFFLLILNIICFGKEKNKQGAIHFPSKTAGLIRQMHYVLFRNVGLNLKTQKAIPATTYCDIKIACTYWRSFLLSWKQKHQRRLTGHLSKIAAFLCFRAPFAIK